MSDFLTEASMAIGDHAAGSEVERLGRVVGGGWVLQEISISFQRDPNELAASTHLGLGEQLLQGILDCAFGNLHARRYFFVG